MESRANCDRRVFSSAFFFSLVLFPFLMKFIFGSQKTEHICMSVLFALCSTSWMLCHSFRFANVALCSSVRLFYCYCHLTFHATFCIVICSFNSLSLNFMNEGVTRIFQARTTKRQTTGEFHSISLLLLLYLSEGADINICSFTLAAHSHLLFIFIHVVNICIVLI